MKVFIRSILKFFSDAAPSLKKQPLVSIIVFIINVSFFLLAAVVLRKLFSGFWDGEVFGRLARRADNPVPLALLHAIGGKPLLQLSLPLSLYLAFSLAFSLATIATGPILARFSRRLQPGFENAEKSSFRSLLFEIREELIMLSHNLNLSALLFLIGAALLQGPALATPLFYLAMPLLYGLYGLSYYCQPRGWSYSKTMRESLSRPAAFAGFAVASATGYFLIFYISSRTPWTSAAFFILLGATALWRTVVTSSGTEFAAQHFGQATSVNKKRKTTTILETLSLFGAALVVFTAAHAASAMRNRMGLLECTYSVSGIRAGLHRDRLFSKAELTIHNPTQEAVTIPDFHFEIQINRATIADLSIRGASIPAAKKHSIPLKGTIRTIQAVKTVFNALKIGKFKPSFRGSCQLPLWFGSIKLYLLRR